MSEAQENSIKDQESDRFNTQEAVEALDKTSKVSEARSEKQNQQAGGAEQGNANVKNAQATKEVGGPKGLEPTRYGDWESKGRCYDF